MNRFSGKAAIVTGAASGIGQASAIRLAQEGACVALLDLSSPEPTARRIQALDNAQKVICYQVNVADIQAVENAIEDAAETFGRLDTLVNSAGIISRALLGEQDPAEWQRVMDVNVNSIFYTSRFAAPLIAQQGGGTIVNIASLSATFGGSNVAYSASKGAVVSLTRHLAHELAGDNIRVNSISPGPVHSGMNKGLKGTDLEKERVKVIPLGRYGEAKEIAAACAFFASEEASYITAVDLVIDGGLSSGKFMAAPADQR